MNKKVPVANFIFYVNEKKLFVASLKIRYLYILVTLILIYYLRKIFVFHASVIIGI